MIGEDDIPEEEWHFSSPQFVPENIPHYLRYLASVQLVSENDIPEDLWHLSSLQFVNEITFYVSTKLHLPFRRSRHTDAYLLPPTPPIRRKWIDFFIATNCPMFLATLEKFRQDVSDRRNREVFMQVAELTRDYGSKLPYCRFTFRWTLMMLIILGIVAIENGFEWGLELAMGQMKICTDRLLCTDLETNVYVRY